jgi:hypothetical protein
LAALGFIAYQGEDGGWSNGDDTKAGTVPCDYMSLHAVPISPDSSGC